MKIETKRLELMPLSPAQLKLWIENIPELEKELDITYMATPLEGVFLEIVKEQLETTAEDPENYMWHSFWFLIRKSDRIVVGSADFKDVPDWSGETEIGYGLGEAFEHNGYMTEALKAMCDWALKQKGVSAVIAETDFDGLASQRILERCGFERYGRHKTIWWRLKRT
jgi:ribosomal-protein-alanine N-acetyltransferase